MGNPAGAWTCTHPARVGLRLSVGGFGTWGLKPKQKWQFWDFQAAYSAQPWLLAGAPPSVGPFRGGGRGGRGSGRSRFFCFFLCECGLLRGSCCSASGACASPRVEDPREGASLGRSWLSGAAPSRRPSRLQPSAARTSATGLAGAWCLGRRPTASACGPPKQPDFLGKAGRGLARTPNLMARNESSAWQGSVPAGGSVPKPPAPSRVCGILVELAVPGQRDPYCGAFGSPRPWSNLSKPSTEAVPRGAT